MGVVKEFTEGSHLVGACDVTGLWPKKFAPATMTIDELHCTAAKERVREREREMLEYTSTLTYIRICTVIHMSTCCHVALLGLEPVASLQGKECRVYSE